jgi:hypothetical protein
MMQRVLARACVSLSVKPGSEDYETLAARLIGHFNEGSTESSLLADLVAGTWPTK